jgi:lactate dehydrogenase-like 2-hydroxyacid dehydrogenase
MLDQITFPRNIYLASEIMRGLRLLVGQIGWGMTEYRILICDPVGLALDRAGQPDVSAVAAHIVAKGGHFHMGPHDGAAGGEGLHFHYCPDLATEAEFQAAAGDGRYDAVIAAASFVPKACLFPQGGVRIGTGTGNMLSASWGGPNGAGGMAPLMNTPGFNARATAQMAFKALLRVRPDLPVAELHRRTVAGQFDTGQHLKHFPTAKLEGQTMAVLGFGNIGREMARLARAFGMVVKVFARAHHHERIAAGGFVPCSTVAAAARGANVLTVHVGLGSLDASNGRFANVGIVDFAVLAALAPGAVVINYDRGECIDVAALDAALDAGQVAHVAVDADIFVNPDGTLRGPLVPYIPLDTKYPGRLELLPHAAADTDHPSRVAGAKQAVDQIFDAILLRRIVNRKGDLPPGYSDGGSKPGV